MRRTNYNHARFERRVVGGSPAARSILFAEPPASGHPPGSPSLCSGCAIFALPRFISAWPRSSGLRLLSGSTQVQILPRRLSEAKPDKAPAPVRSGLVPRVRDGEHDLSPPPFFLESKTAKRGDRLEAVSSREACGAGPLLSATLESEPAEARALFRKQMDRLCRLGRKSPALFVVPPASRAPAPFTPHFCRGCAIFALSRSVRQHWLVAQKQSARPISE